MLSVLISEEREFVIPILTREADWVERTRGDWYGQVSLEELRDFIARLESDSGVTPISLLTSKERELVFHALIKEFNKSKARYDFRSIEKFLIIIRRLQSDKEDS